MDYTERLLDARAERPADYFAEQPFGQVPCYSDKKVSMFETEAIVLHIGEKCEALLPREAQQRARAMSWVIASLNSVEPAVMQLASLDLFHAGENWTVERRPQLEAMVRLKLKRISDHMGKRDWLEKGFTAGDLMMTTVMHILRDTNIVAEYPNIAAWQARCEARPAFERALSAQMTAFEKIDA